MTFKLTLGISGMALLGLNSCNNPSAETPATPPPSAPAPAPTQVAGGQTTFPTPEVAGEALVSAAERFDVTVLKQILGANGVDLVVTDDPVQDKNQSAAFATMAREKIQVVRDPRKPGSAALIIGPDAWPLPIPLVEENGRWRFDSEAGRQEVLYRRIGRNELDAIEVCRIYVDAQYEYAAQTHGNALVNQYAQHIMSTSGKQDGLAWQAAGGAWEGPLGHEVAGYIAEGYSDRRDPLHGYYFKILKGQGPSAPMGEMDFVVKGVMIGGFGLVAAPSNYRVNGVKTFIVGPNGVVLEKDLGPDTLELFRAMERFDPDPTWTPVQESDPEK